MKKYKTIALGALIATGFASCELTEKPTSYYEKDTYFQTADQAKMSVVGIYDCLATNNHYGQFEMAMPRRMTLIIYKVLVQTIHVVI